MEDRRIAARLWLEEPALRRLAQRLDTYLPGRWTPTECPLCNNAHIRRTGQTRGDVKVFACAACDHQFAATLGTPFYRLQPQSHLRLYRTAVVLWGPWTPYIAWKIAGCSDAKQLGQYRQLIEPLLEEIDERPLVSKPAYRLGFSPADQGIRCLRCKGDELSYAKRHDPDNPCFKCSTCGYSFFLFASRRHLLPIAQNVHCPGCEGKNLIRKTERTDGRIVYRCKDCSRGFIFPRKKFQPSKYGRQNERMVPENVSCPSCTGTNIRITTKRQDGRAVYGCNDCARQFLDQPKRAPTRLKHAVLANPPT